MADEVVGGIVGKVEIDDGNLDVQLARLKASLAAVEGQLRQAGAGGVAASRQFGDLAARKADLRAQIDQVTASMKAQAAETRQLAVGMNGIARGGMNTGQKLMIMGQVMDDAQYGMVALTNQAGQVAMALGLGAGVGGAAMAAMVAVSQLHKNWHGFTTLVGMGGVETAAEEMERLGDKTKRTADEQARLNDLKREEKTWTDVGEGKSPAERATESAMMGALGGAPGRDVLKGLTEVNRDVVKMTPKDREDIETARERDAILKAADTGTIPLQPLHQIFRAVHGTEAEVRERINKRLADENLQVSKNLIDNAIHGIGRVGESARKQLLRIVQENPGAFPEGLARDLEAATPEGREAADQARLEARGSRQARLIEQGLEKKAKAEEVAQAQLEARGSRQRRLIEQDLKRKADAERAALTVAEGVDEAENEDNFREYLRGKLDRGERLTPGERESGGPEVREAEQEMMQGQLDRQMEHGVRMNALGKRLREAMAPEIRSSQVMNSSQLNASVQASVTNGPSAEEKRIVEVRDAVQAIKDELVRFNRPVRAGGR